MHRRQAIRDQAVAAITGLPTTGANVFNELAFPFEQHQLPAWVVYTGEEVIETADMNQTQDRTLELVFVGVARGTHGDSVKDTLDTMLEELETALLVDPFTLFTGLMAFELVSVEPELDAEDTDAVQMAFTVVFAAQYQTTEGAPGA